MTVPTLPPSHIRLLKRVAEQCQCSRSNAEQYIENGFVRVEGRVEEHPGARVRPDQSVTLDPEARLLPLTPVTLLLHKPPGLEAGLGPTGPSPQIDTGPKHTERTATHSRSQGAPPASTLLHAASQWKEDASGLRVLQRHFKQQECFTPLPTEASGLVVYTQDPSIARKLAQDIEVLEQECIVEVRGDIEPDGLQRLCHGLSFNGRALPPIKVSWQSEHKLRFALKGIRPGQVRAMCEAVGLQVVELKRIRIGRVPLAKLPQGQWRYLSAWERF